MTRLEEPQVVPTSQRSAELPATLAATDMFVPRHIGPRDQDVHAMLDLIGAASLDDLIAQTVPESIRLRKPLALHEPRGEFETLNELRQLARRNKVARSFIGMGYHDCITPPVIQRNILENPGWYTQYTPYQAEIAQGRLEALLNFQTMVADLTGLPLANASLLDEATAAAEAMAMCRALNETPDAAFFIADDCHPQTIAVVQTRARSMGIKTIVGTPAEMSQIGQLFGLLLQYPSTDGRIVDYTDLIAKARAAGVLTVVAADLLALTLIKPPGEMNADIAVGSTQRFGIPMGFGGPHAAYLATRTEYARKIPGRIVGVSRDVHGNTAYRLAIQTREQHIRREKATSNICTAQVLLAIMAGMYAVYHGPAGLRRIAERIHAFTALFATGLRRLGHDIGDESFFDTLRIRLRGIKAKDILDLARVKNCNLRDYADGSLGVSFDETISREDLITLLDVFSPGNRPPLSLNDLLGNETELESRKPRIENRKSPFLSHPVFNTHHSETEVLRYITRLQSRDLSLAQSMIPLGSCTMKLNATSEMLPVTWPEFCRIHPFAPAEQTRGYAALFRQLEKWLAEITGFKAVSLQPNAGSQGEYAGLLAIRAYHESRNEPHRNICLIPVSAHGTNPSSAVIAGFKVVAVACDSGGNVDLEDLQRKAKEHEKDLAALMITYPSTHGVFEEDIRQICQVIHQNGGQVYMDGANMNAQVGLCRPGDIGADVCHLNLHKTFCIPHGGGGPGMGPICVAKHLAAFLPANPLGPPSSAPASGAVSAAPYGSAAILPIPYMYIAMMGGPGLTRASQIAILNANYMMKRLEAHYPVLFKGKHGRCAHEFILDCRQFEQSSGVKVEDIAKRLMDYGFHAPTISFPVPGTLMIEPTESEPKHELDRFCDALISIREEIRAIEESRADRTDNVLKNAPHTIAAVSADNWTHKYAREQAAFPARWLRDSKFWPSVARIDNPFGDRNLMCACPPVENYRT